MDNLFGIPLTSILIGLLVLLAAALAVLAFIVIRQPLLARMGLRNIGRRPSQTTLIVIGLMLSTLIISAAFATGDTVGYSVTNTIYRSFEEVDYVIAFDSARHEPGRADYLTDGDLERIEAGLGADPDIDGITGMLVQTLPVLNPDARLSEPSTQAVGIDPSSADSFGALRDLNDQLVPADTLSGNRVYITEDLARAIDAGEGDSIRLFANNEPFDFEVIGVVRDTSLTGAITNLGTTTSGSGGVIMLMDTAREMGARSDELTFVLISARGDARGSAAIASEVEDRIDAFIEATPDLPVQIAVTKAQLVTIGEIAGSLFVTLFVVFGLFSIAAGILLIFLIFVMLAAERRSEMGMARAIGMNRLHLTMTFLTEGMAYNLGSAAIGALLGLGVAWLLVTVMSNIFGEFGLQIAFHFNWQGFLIAYSLGVVLTFATVAYSSWRSANLNIVRAIRDLPEPQPFRGSRNTIPALLRSAVGVGWYLVWLAMATLWVIAGVALFFVGLGTFGIGIVLGAILAAWFVYGARAAARPFPETRGVGRVIYILWWVVFTPLALQAPITWALLRTKPWADRHRTAGGWALWMLVIGIFLTWWGGWQIDQLFAYTGGITLAVLALAMLATYFGANTRAAFTIAGLALLWFWLLPLPFSLLFEEGAGWTDPVDGLLRVLGLPRPHEMAGNIDMFFVSGVCMTAAGTLVVIFNADLLLNVVALFGRLLGGIAPAVRTAVAYPLAAKFRTAMTLAMFALVVFSLVVMSALNYNFTQLFLGEDADAGFNVSVEGNPANPIPDLRAALAESGSDVGSEIAGVGRLTQVLPQARQVGVEPEDEDGDGFRQMRVQGVDDEFLDLAVMPFQLRAIGYETDAAVIEALRTDPDVAVVDANVLALPEGAVVFGPGGGANPFRLDRGAADLREAPWEPIAVTLRDPETGDERQLSVIAVIDSQVTGLLPPLFGSTFVHEDVLAEAFGEGEVINYLVSTVDQSEAGEVAVANAIESALLESGVQAQSIQRLMNDSTAQASGFQLLFEAFMGLGLIVGIAALGVIAFRTVVERRQQIGMLRAIGYTRRLVALSFFMESSFIAILGTGMGFVLGLALSYNLLTSPEFTDGTEINFQVPWLRLLVIGGIAYLASALMTIIPARAASRVAVAEALRYE